VVSVAMRGGDGGPVGGRAVADARPIWCLGSCGFWGGFGLV
jgi:hypothetical protein